MKTIMHEKALAGYKTINMTVCVRLGNDHCANFRHENLQTSLIYNLQAFNSAYSLNKCC